MVELVKHFPVNTTRQSWHCWWWVRSNKPLVLTVIFTVLQRWSWYKFSDAAVLPEWQKISSNISILPNAENSRSGEWLKPNITSCSERWWITGTHSLTRCIPSSQRKILIFLKRMCSMSSAGNWEITLLLEYVGCARLSESFTQVFLGRLSFLKGKQFYIWLPFCFCVL